MAASEEDTELDALLVEAEVKEDVMELGLDEGSGGMAENRRRMELTEDK
jgi:hypothetical protein